MKKTLVMIAIILIIAPGFIKGNTVDEKDIMVKILDDLDSTYLRGDISANEEIYGKFLELDVLEGIGYNIKDNLDMIETDRIQQSEENYVQLNLHGYDKDNNQIMIILSSYFDENVQKGDTYLYINFLNKEQFLNINGIIDNVEEIYDNYNSDVEITTNIVGTIDGRINFDEYEDRINNRVNHMNGNILDKYKDDNLISYNAYTESIDNHILIGKNKMNLNIALRYSESEDRTLVYIGSPIISGGY